MQVRSALFIALRIIGWGSRLCAVALCVLTCCLCFSKLAGIGLVAGLSAQLAYALPAAVAGWGLTATPFGGVFRLDFACLALLLFLLDFACTRAAAAIIRAYPRGPRRPS